MRTLRTLLAVVFCAGPAAALSGRAQSCKNIPDTVRQEQLALTSLERSLAQIQSTSAGTTTPHSDAAIVNSFKKQIRTLQNKIAADKLLSHKLHCVSDCPSNLFAHNTGHGLMPYSCVTACPAGTHPSEPGDFPYTGARACMAGPAPCPSNLFAHNAGHGLMPYSCVTACPAGTHPSAPGDFPYWGARACMR